MANILLRNPLQDGALARYVVSSRGILALCDSGLGWRIQIWNATRAAEVSGKDRSIESLGSVTKAVSQASGVRLWEVLVRSVGVSTNGASW